MQKNNLIEGGYGAAKFVRVLKKSEPLSEVQEADKVQTT